MLYCKKCSLKVYIIICVHRYSSDYDFFDEQTLCI